jgi:hypothetical protein
VPVDDWLGSFPVVVEAGGGHGRLDGLDGSFPFGNARFELLDAPTQAVSGFLDLTGFGLSSLPLVVGFGLR